VSLEHQYAATFLARLLAGAPASELGDRIEIRSVRLQASDVSPVDDILLEGVAPGGEVHRTSIGVRRDPQLNASDTKSVPLIAAYLSTVVNQWDEVSSGRWSLALAVATARQAYTQLDVLCGLARSNPDAASFLAAVGRPAATNEGDRQRLAYLRTLVEQASKDDATLSALSVDELIWRWLSALQVRRLRLEGTDTEDRTTSLTILQSVVTDGTPGSADSVYSRLVELAADYAARAGQVTGGMLRRELSTFPIKPLELHSAAWRVMDRLEELLRDQTGSTIATGAEAIHLDRTEAAGALRATFEQAAATAAGVVVTGEPDVGKSALTLQVCDDLRAADAVVVAVSLRDLRGSVMELESALGGVNLNSLFAGASTAPVRLLVVDGCEAVMEGHERLFSALASAAARAGFGVAGVSRADGSQYVGQALAGALRNAGQPTEVRVHTVDELNPTERTDLANSVGSLARVQGDPRSAWILGRPGLVDAVLRAGPGVEPGDLLCEADVFSAVWNGLILRNGTQPPGAAAPEDRESAAVALARRRLGGETEPAGQALRELRSDGVLRAESNPAFSRGPDFSTDLYRDFSLCKLFLFSGWEPLATAGAPRWTIRSVRLACQATLSNRDAGSRSDVWKSLVDEFTALAESEGVRWIEVPYEALFTLGDARDALTELWDVLVADGGIDTLLRLATVRYVQAGFGDQFALAPIVDIAFCEERDLGSARRRSHDTPRKKLNELVLAWLRGMGQANRGPDPIRQRVRDVILAQDPPRYDEFAIEALALLGRDLDDAAEAWLRQVAADRPSSLYEVPESIGVVVSLAHVKPDLLLDLSEAYYIKKPDRENSRYGWGGRRDYLDDGIRDFRHGRGFTFGAPQAAWYYGPFYRLLLVSPAKTIAFINRMLDQASLFRVTDDLPPDPVGDRSGYQGVTLALTERSGSRHYVGDNHVWNWYRGTSVGPYACMSALLALEKYIDYLHENVGIPLGTVVDLLLTDCNNLAVPGLLTGFLVRHLDDAGDLLDPLLAEVAIWHLETSRVTMESSFRARDRDADNLTGQDKRQYSPHDIAGWMVVNARLRGDETRLAELERIGERLLASAQRDVDLRRAQQAAAENEAGQRALSGETNGADEAASPVETDAAAVAAEAAEAEADQYIALVRSWAAEFQIASYEASAVDEGVVIQFERPAEIEKALAPRTEQLEVVAVLYRLQSDYALKNETPEQWPVSALNDDLAIARAIEELEDSPEGFLWPENPVVAVAAAAVRAHALSAAELTQDDLAWAAEMVLLGAEHPRVDASSVSSSLYSMGADRAAAIAVPLLLLAPFDGLHLDPERLRATLDALASSVYDEVRTSFAKGCAEIWVAPCDSDGGGACRRHSSAWAAVENSLAAARLGPWEFETQSRLPGTLEPPYESTLLDVPADELLVNRLRMPVVCTDAALRVPCLAEQAARLAAPLWDAHRRGLDRWWREGYDHLGERHQEPVTRLFIGLAKGGEREALDAHLRTFAGNAHALQMLMHSFATVFSYDAELRPFLADFWVPSLAVILDAIDAGADLMDDRASWFDWAVAELLPTPQIESSDLDPDATLDRCRTTWADPNAFDDVIDRWLRLSKGEPKAADAVARFARTAPTAWQRTTALDWLEAIIDGNYAAFSNRVWSVTRWLGELRAAGPLTTEVQARYRRIVDGLAAGGDGDAVALQQLEE